MQLKLLLLTIFISANVFAQALPIRNDTPTTLRDLGANLNVGRNFAVDQYGRMQCVMPAGANSSVKAEDSGHTTGDLGNVILGVVNTSLASWTSTQADYSALSTNQYGAMFCELNAAIPSSTVNVPYRLEDDAVVGSSAVMMMGGVNNRSAGAFNSTNGDATPIGVGDYGNVYSTLFYDAQIFGGFSPITKEDNVFSTSDSIVMAGVRYISNTSGGQSAGTSGDASVLQNDTDGRLYVNPFGANPTEFVVGCNTAITTATTGSMIAADADERYYITSWNCTNTGGAASRVILEDADGTDFANLLLAATTGNADITFPTPVRMGAINKAVQINVITTGTSTICCASGFKSQN